MNKKIKDIDKKYVEVGKSFVEKSFEFENFVNKLFRKSNFSINDRDTKIKYDHNKIFVQQYDFIAVKDKKYIVEVKYSLSGKIGLNNIKSKIEKIKNSECVNDCDGIIIVTNSFEDKEMIKKLNLDHNTYYLNLFDILYLVENDEEVIYELKNTLDFSIEDIILPVNNQKEYKYKDILREIGLLRLSEKDLLIENLKDRIATWKQRGMTGKNHAKEYEKNCTEILKYLFADELTIFSNQKNSNRRLYFFDMICRIKNNNNSDFWSMMENYFNSKYIIFEYKNYVKKITQKEIYSTEKYLYAKALRSVAIIITCGGLNDNAMIAANGSLRENGKLILCITNEDLVNMIEAKERGDKPSDYLMDKLDNVLMELEK